MKIVVLDAYSVVGSDMNLDFLKKYDDVKIYDTTKREQLIQRCKDAQVILTSKCVIDKEIIDECKNLKYVSEMATGYNNIDVQYCKEKGIVVTNVPSYASNNVSELVFAYLLDVFYNVRDYDTAIKQGDWINAKDYMFHKHTTYNLAGKTMGIIGYGNIAKEVEKKALAFNMNVIINKRSKDDDKKFVSLDYLLANSDIITIHVPLNDETKNFINKDNIAKMKDNVVFVNTARGAVVDEKALVEALNSGKIAHACLDVLSKEPMEKDSVLLDVKNITMTPHIGWAAFETRAVLIDVLDKNLKAYIDNTPINVVNR